MKTIRLFPVLFALMWLAGCGVASSGSGGTGGNTGPGMQGAWEITAISNMPSGVQTLVEADFSQSADNVSSGGRQLVVATIQGGIAQVNPCSTQPSFSGTLNGTALSGTLTEGTQSIQITGTLSADGKSATGTYTGGCMNGDNGTFTASSIAPVSGTFSGTLTDNSNNPAATTIQVTDGGNESFTAMGQVTDQNVMYNLSVSNGSQIGALFGGAGTSSNANGSTQIVAAGHLTATATAIDAFVIGDETTGNLIYTGTLSKRGAAAAVVAPAFRFSGPVPQIGAKNPNP
jgi:hypothetical protein